jgi:hypothetical protein
MHFLREWHPGRPPIAAEGRILDKPTQSFLK